MNFKYKYSLIFGGLLLFTACSENSWNDHLDGFQKPPVYGATPTVEVTLPANAYAAIASNKTNIELAEKSGEEDVLQYISAHKCFPDEKSAINYIPAYLDDTSTELHTYSYNSGSSLKITYNLNSSLPESVQSINEGVLTYTLEYDDYEMLWGADDFFGALTPTMSPENVLPTLLLNNLSPREGQYAVVTYNYAQQVGGSYQTISSLWQYDGSKWSEQTGVQLLQTADYKRMGLNYANFSSGQAETYLPKFLSLNYPYASETTSKIICWCEYASGASTYKAAEYILKDGLWTMNTGEETSQFTKQDNNWKFNPSVIITLPYSRNTDPSYTYYMACVNWVFENIVLPMDPSDTLTSGNSFIDYRGNAEFYSGASAFYGNVDVRASSAINHKPADYTVYDGMSDEEITLLMKKRFCTEVMKGALEKLHPDARFIEGMEITYTINFTSYAPAVTNETLVYTVVGPGKFAYKSCTWFTNGEDAGWE